MKTFLRATAILAIAAFAVFGSSTAPACTGITIKPKDGSVIFARTLEFAADLKSNVIVVPRGTEYVGTAPGNKPGLRWKTKYGTVGANAFDLPVVVDGLNEKGLHVGLFYFPGFAKYQEVKADDLGKALAPWEIGSYLLGTCPDVKEAVAAAKSVLVGEVVQKDMGFSKTAQPVDKAKEGVLQAFHLLNQFDIPKEAAQGIEHGKEVYDYTLWTSAADLKNLRYYFRTFDNSRIRMVDMKAVNLDAQEIKTISMKGEEEIEDVSGRTN